MCFTQTKHETNEFTEIQEVYYSAWLVAGKLKKFPSRQVSAQSESQNT